MNIESAVLAFDGNGTPFSKTFDDVYHSANSGPGQARHVFLGGNELPGRWRGRESFTILETGFGLGINFLATWQAWRDDPARPARLHYVSIEKHPFRRDDLQQLHARYPDFAVVSPLLLAAWPLPLAGSHHLHFDDERVTLTLIFDDVAQALPRVRGGVDAFYLDGFSPQKNAAMWEPRVIQSLARLARADATLATYTTARTVKDGLTQAGFVHERSAGFGSKRDMLAARYRPHWQPRHAPPETPAWPRRHAIVIGAGIAAGSGMHAGAFHPLLARDDSIAARLTRAGFLYALQRWAALERTGHTPDWQRCGLLQLAENHDDLLRMQDTIAALDLPPDYARMVDATVATTLAGVGLRNGGYWFPQGGWMRAGSLAAACLACADNVSAVATHYGNSVDRLERRGDEWLALAADGSVIAAAPVVVLANAGDATRLVEFAHPLQLIRGQVAHLNGQVTAPQVVMTGTGYLLPAIDGVTLAGASYDFDDGDPLPHAAGRAQIAAQLRQMLDREFNIDDADGRVGFRCVAVDRLPLVGAVADVVAARANASALSGAQPADLPRLPGLYSAIAYGSRGLVWSGIAAELLACQLEGNVLPLEGDLVDAIDPGRFVIKRLRHGAL